MSDTSRKYPIEDLTLDPRLQARVALDQGAVDDYAAAYAAKATLPPVDVYMVGETPYVVDGWHRIAGARIAGEQWMRAVIVGTGSIDDAIWRALASNQAHGVRRSNADKRRAIRLALDSAIGVEQSSRALAEHIGVGKDLVSEVRAEWEAERRAEGVGRGVSATSPEKRKDSVGRMQPAKRARPEPMPPSRPEATEDVPPLPHEIMDGSVCPHCHGSGRVG